MTVFALHYSSKLDTSADLRNAFLFPDLLRSEGENHPTDDKIEQENRIDGKGFAVWRLTVSKESCRG